MIKEILNGFKCDAALLAEAEALAATQSVVAQAVAVGMIGAYWQPVAYAELAKASFDTTPVMRARAWADQLPRVTLGQVWTARAYFYEVVREFVLTAELRELDEEERAREWAMRRRLQAINFILGCPRTEHEAESRLEETTLLPAPIQMPASTADEIAA